MRQFRPTISPNAGPSFTFPQVGVLHLQLFPQSIDFLARARIRDSDGGLVGEHPKPGEGSFIQELATRWKQCVRSRQSRRTKQESQMSPDRRSQIRAKAMPGWLAKP